MKNNIKEGIVEVNGIKIGDVIDSEGVVIGFGKKENGSWEVYIRECGEGGWSRDIEEIN